MRQVQEVNVYQELRAAKALIRRIAMATSTIKTDTNDLFRTVNIVNVLANDFIRGK